MKKLKLMSLGAALLSFILLPGIMKAQDKDIVQDCNEAKAVFVKKDPSMQQLFNSSYAYVILPNVGNGIVYQKGKMIGKANMVQATVGAQAGGQAYREVIFLEDKAALDRFKDNKIEFSGQVSAVAVKAGASADAKYREGVAVFTEEKGGLMVEASLGGQKFTFKSL